MTALGRGSSLPSATGSLTPSRSEGFGRGRRSRAEAGKPRCSAVSEALCRTRTGDPFLPWRIKSGESRRFTGIFGRNALQSCADFAAFSPCVFPWCSSIALPPPTLERVAAGGSPQAGKDLDASLARRRSRSALRPLLIRAKRRSGRQPYGVPVRHERVGRRADARQSLWR